MFWWASPAFAFTDACAARGLASKDLFLVQLGNDQVAELLPKLNMSLRPHERVQVLQPQLGPVQLVKLPVLRMRRPGRLQRR